MPWYLFDLKEEIPEPPAILCELDVTHVAGNEESKLDTLPVLENATYTRAKWRAAVAEGKTIKGYFGWVTQQITQY